ncbi:MAG: DUF3857 domain-containing transglutaminase family protein [Dissulfurispiraceae bacterium]|jgi:hypothetical protein
MTHRKTTYITVFLAMLTISILHTFALADETLPVWEQKYKDDPYIVLLLEETITINPDYSTITHRHTIQKIQNESAKSLGELTFLYDQDREEITSIEAYTITPDGKKLQYEKIQDLSTSGENSIYSDARKKVITMPGVVVGSIIDSEVTIKRHKPIIEHNFFDNFRFSASYPIKEARYSVTAPQNTPLNIKVLNATVDSKVESSDDKVTYTWTIHNSDKVEREEYMPSPEEVYKFISISTLKDWKQLSDWAEVLFKKNMIVTDEMKQKVALLTKGKTTLADKVQAIIEYIRQDYRYVSMNMNSHNYEPHRADEIFKNKYGDCKDQTLLAITLLSEMGVKAFPTFMSSYSDLHREDLLPMPLYFNHAILAIEFEGKRYYTDVLDKGYRFKELPADYEGKRVFTLNDRTGFFTVLPVKNSDDKNTVEVRKVTIKDDGTALVEDNATLSKDISVLIREGIKKLSPEQREKVLAAMETSIVSGGKVLEKAWKNIDTPYEPIVLSIRFESSSIVQRMGDMMVFGLPSAQRKSLFSAPKRLYPIVFLSEDQTEVRVTYIIPNGYEVSVIPKTIGLNPPFAAYLREYTNQGTQIIGKELVEFKPSRVPVEDYPSVQHFLDDIAGKTNDRILIKKKG